MMWSVLECLCSQSSLLLIGVITILGFWYYATRKTRNLPPGPPALPVIGSLLSLAGGDVIKSFDGFRRKYGDIFTIYFGQRPVVVFNGLEVLREAFVKNGDLFNNRPRGMVYDRFTEAHGIILSNGQAWKEQRRFALSVLRDLGLGKNRMEQSVLDEAAECLTALRSFKGEPFDPYIPLATTSCNIIFRVTFGKRFDFDDKDFKLYYETMNVAMELCGGTALGHFFPFLEYCPGDPLKIGTLGECDRIIKTFLRKGIEDHKSHPEQYDHDFIESYLHEVLKRKDVDPDSSFNEKTLLAILSDFFVAGTDTSSSTLAWALLYLATKPEIQRKAQEEIDRTLGDRLLAMDFKRHMPYIEALTMEIQRLANVTPFAVVHAPVETLSYKGFTIPGETLIIPNLGSVFSDPDVWGDPENFRPERFLNDDGKIKHDEMMIPFSLGKRTCLGESLARMELFLLLVSLLRTFTFRLPEGATPNFQYVMGVTRKVKPYQICAIERGNDKQT